MTELRHNDILLSQLVDGELTSDETNGVLLSVLDDAQGRQLLRGMLQLRHGLAPLRNQQPPRPVVATLPPADKRHWRLLPWRLPALGAAAVIGGLLVMAGFWMTGNPAQPPRATFDVRHPLTNVVTAERRRELASVFALHESVAGPLKWYAADDRNISVSHEPRGESAAAPIAVLLRLIPTGGPEASTKTYVIVCRDRHRANIDLPEPQVASRVSLRLLPEARDGEVKIRYAINASRPGDSAEVDAALAGQRHVGLDRTPLGQIALGDRLVNVEASAWIIRDRNP